MIIAIVTQVFKNTSNSYFYLILCKGFFCLLVFHFAEIIGHLETFEGKNLGEVVVINKNKMQIKSKFQKTKVKKKNKFICTYCGKSFIQRSKYIVHKSFHKTTKYQCMRCEKQFSTKENLFLHQTTEAHAGERIIEINDKENISKDLESLESLDTYESTKPDSGNTVLHGEAGFNSDEDNDDPNNVETENINVLTSTDGSQDFISKDYDSLQCERCNKHFQSKKSLETHVKVVHLGEKPYVCEICNKAFAYDSSLKGHHKTVHQVVEFYTSIL